MARKPYTTDLTDEQWATNEASTEARKSAVVSHIAVDSLGLLLATVVTTLRWRMCIHRGAMYVIGWSKDQEQIRTFKVDRISAVDVQSGLQFTRPADFDPASFLEHSFGIFTGEGPLQSIRSVKCLLAGGVNTIVSHLMTKQEGRLFFEAAMAKSTNHIGAQFSRPMIRTVVQLAEISHVPQRIQECRQILKSAIRAFPFTGTVAIRTSVK